MSKSKKYHTKNTLWNENDNFKNKFKSLKKTIKDNVYVSSYILFGRYFLNKTNV